MLKHNPLYIFVHIPKCAGSSFSHTLKQKIPKSGFLAASYTLIGKQRPDSGYIYTKADLDDYLSTLSDSNKAALTAITGHLNYFGMHKHFERECRYITFIRDPAERLYSHYLFLLQRIENGAMLSPKLRESLFDQGGSVLDFADWVDTADIATNYITKFFKGIPEFENIIVESEDVIQIVNDLQRYYYIGLTNEYDTDADFLFRKIGIPGSFIKRNVAKQRDDSVLKNASLIAKIMANNALDYQIYHEALKIRDARRAFFGIK